MKLASYKRRDGVISFGVVEGEDVLDATERFSELYGDLGGVLHAGALDEMARETSQFRRCKLTEVDLLPPILNPGKIICVGLNYKSHIAETGRPMPTYPTLFTRYPATLVGHNQKLLRPQVSEQFDFEGELAFVIGRGGRNIARSDASKHIVGYCCFNDGSIRDFQRHTSQFWPGKNFDQSGSFGPFLVTKEEVKNVSELSLTTKLNGQAVQSASIGDLLFDPEFLVEYLSSITTLHPGDLVATGTPSGVGAFREPKMWMKPGDVVEVDIPKLGILRNSIAEAA